MNQPIAIALFSTDAAFGGSPVEGRWDGVRKTSKAEIPFRLDVSGSGGNFKGTLFNDDDMSKIKATYTDGKLTGNVETRGDKSLAGSRSSAKVAKIHAGFASAACGEYNRHLKEEFTSTIERLLDHPSGSTSNSARLR